VKVFTSSTTTYKKLDTKPTKQITPGTLVKTTRYTYTFFVKKQLQKSGLCKPMKMSEFIDMTSLEVPKDTCMMFLSCNIIHKQKSDAIGNSDIFTAQAKVLLDDQVVHVDIPYSSGTYQGSIRNAYAFLYSLFEVVSD
jgi:hypothetical protein